MKDLFTGALGRLNNHGGSRIYTTPNTILVPPEYEIEIGEHGNFISCTLDGRLWLFEDRIIALKWNKEAEKMEYAASKSFSDENFVARGRDWILTDKSVIQITDSSPYIFHETHNKNVTPMENFYSLLPPLQGFQIIKNYLIRKPNESYENLMYPISMPDIYLNFYRDTIYARDNLGIGTINISNHEGVYSIDFNYSYNFSDDSWQNMGIAFIGEKIYGFKNKENNKGLCLCSENNQIYSLKNSSWSSISENEGNIFFDPFNRSGIMIDNKGINLLASNKSTECKTLSQWIVPAKQIQSIDDDMIISSVDNSVLATYINLGFYRSLLLQKTLPLTTKGYEKANDKLINLSLGIIGNKAFINSFEKYKDVNDLTIEFLDSYVRENSIGWGAYMHTTFNDGIVKTAWTTYSNYYLDHELYNMLLIAAPLGTGDYGSNFFTSKKISDNMFEVTYEWGYFDTKNGKFHERALTVETIEDEYGNPDIYGFFYGKNVDGIPDCYKNSLLLLIKDITGNTQNYLIKEVYKSDWVKFSVTDENIQEFQKKHRNIVYINKNSTINYLEFTWLDKKTKRYYFNEEQREKLKERAKEFGDEVTEETLYWGGTYPHSYINNYYNTQDDTVFFHVLECYSNLYFIFKSRIPRYDIQI